MRKVTKALRNIVSVILALAVFGLSATPVFAAEANRSNQLDARLLQQPAKSATPTTHFDGNPVLSRSSTEIGSTVQYIYGTSGTLTVGVSSSCIGANVVVGTYDSDDTGSIDVFMRTPSSKGRFIIGSCHARNDHIEYHLTFCQKGTYTFYIEGSTAKTKLCYVRIFNV